MELSSSLKKRFIKETGLPIHVFREPNFTKSIELIDEDFNSKEKLETFKKMLIKFPNEKLFLEEFHRVNQELQNLIKDTDAYKKFIELDFKLYNEFVKKIKQENKFEKNLYKEQNSGKMFISIDLKEANFNVLRKFGCYEEMSAKELFSNVTEDLHLLNSKYLRQVVFGNLNPKRQVKYEEYLMCKLFTKLPERYKNNLVLNTDELIFEFDWVHNSVEELIVIVNKFKEEFDAPVNIELFSLQCESDKKGKLYFIKSDVDGKLSFKGIQNLYFNQVYKFYKGIEVEPEDLMFYHEGMLAEFKETLF